MTTPRRTGHRSASAAILIVGGGGLSAATWAAGEHGLAVGLVGFYVLAASVAYLWAGGAGDVAAIMRAGGDERQRGLDRDATAITGLTLVVAAIIGAIMQTAHTGNPGAYGVLCAVGGIAYCVSLIALRRRR